MPLTLSKREIQEIVLNSRARITENISIGGEQKIIVQKAAEEYGFKINDKESAEIFTVDFPGKGEIEYGGAVIQIEGNYSIPAVHKVEMIEGSVKIHLYIYQQTLTNRKNRELSRKLVEKKVVMLFPGTDEEWLYEALSETSDEYFYETVKEKAKGLPIYTVKFKEDGSFIIEEMEPV